MERQQADKRRGRSFVSYGIKVQFYQHEAGTLPISIKINDVAVAGLGIPKDSLIIYHQKIPAVLYQNSSIDLKIYGNIAVSGTMVLYEYERVKPKGGAQDAGPEQILSGNLRLTIYPVPTRKELIVEDIVPVKTNITISLYDVTGRLIAIPVNGEYPAGHFGQAMRTKDLSPGVYFMRITGGKYSAVKKVTIIK